MTHILRRQWLRDSLVGLMLALAALGLLITPKTTSEAAREGLYICLDVLIPSLFPFFVISTLTIEMGFTQIIGRALDRFMRPLFNVSGPCAAAVALGFIGGYPVGAKCAISLYEKKQCSREEAERLLAFCNNSGPAFILGAAGVGILGSSKAGWLLFLTHTAASVTVGILFRFYKRGKNAEPLRAGGGIDTVRFTDAFIRSVKSSFASVFYISAFVIFFTVVIRMLYTAGFLSSAAGTLSRLLEPLGMTKDSAQNLLTGLIEMTSGLFSLQGAVTAKLAGKMAMAAFMLGWAGLSVHCQVLSFIGQSGLSARTYIAGKLLHGGISAVYAFLLTGLFPFDMPTAQTVAEQVETIARLRFWDTLRVTLAAAVIFVLTLLLLTAGLLMRRYRRSR